MNALLETVRLGQRSLVDRQLAELTVTKGLLSLADSQAALADCAPGTLALRLVETGRLSDAQLKTLIEERAFQDVLDTVSDQSAPDDVLKAAQDPARRVGRYVLVSEIGAGGMGVVWRGWDSQLSRWVAVKQLKVQDPQLISRFMREASLLAQLAHPNITSVFEIGVDEGQPFLVMELVDGGSPSSRSLLEGDAPTDGTPSLVDRSHRVHAATVIRDAARAVHYAHEHQIIHRDLKPSNLLVNSRGRVFVTDFGLARMREEGVALTQSGALLGTPSFMAPEQAQGRDADDRTDVYGLGATLYALVEGEPPYTGEVVHEVVKRVAMSNPPALKGNDDLVVIVGKAMERDREDRYQSAAELADELDRYIADEPILARPLNPLQRTWRRAQRKPAQAGAIAAGALIALSAAVWGGLQLNDFYTRQAQIQDADVFISNSRFAADRLREFYSSNVVDDERHNRLLIDLANNADAALAAAPGLADGEYYKGMAHFWNFEYEEAYERFTAALADDPNHDMSRAYRIVASNQSTGDCIPALVEYEDDTFGVEVVMSDSPDVRARVAQLKSEATMLRPEHTQIGLVRSILAACDGDSETAARSLDDYLANDPSDAYMQGQLILLLLAAGDSARAKTLSQEVLDKGRYPSVGHWGLAYAHAIEGDLEQAAEALEMAQAYEWDEDNQYFLDQWRQQTGYYSTRFETLTRMLDEDEDNLLVRASRIEVAIDNPEPDPEQLEIARSDAARLVERTPEDARSHFLYGRTLAETDSATAIKALERAIALDPNYAGDAGAQIAYIQRDNGNLGEAIEAFTSALAASPETAEWINDLARIHIRVGQFDEAVALTQPRQWDPESQQTAALALDNLGQHAAAATAQRQAIVNGAGDPDLLLTWALYAASAGLYDSVEQAFEGAEQLGATPTEVDRYRVQTLLRTDRLQEALSLASQVVDRADAYDWDHYALGLIHFNTEAHGQALSAFANAIEIDPEHFDYQILAARTLAALDQQSSATRYLPFLSDTNADPDQAAVLWLELGECAAALATLGKTREALDEQDRNIYDSYCATP